MIESRRLKLGLSESQIAETIGISLDSYCDIESHADELCRAVELRRIKTTFTNSWDRDVSVVVHTLFILQC
jgi:DNA-binding XRE family transcriptional regulator